MSFFSFFCQPEALNGRAVDGHKMYSGSSVVGKASGTFIEIAPTLPLLSQGGGSKRAKFGIVFDIT